MLFSALRQWPQQKLARILAGMPSCCALCGQSGKRVICDGCSKHYFSRHPARCRQCANLLPQIDGPAPTLCGNCLKQPRAFDATIVACDYTAPADQLILALKFGGQLALAPVFAQMLCEAGRRSLCNHPELELPADLPDILTAVPLSAQRLQQRGFNQALEIAKPFARMLGLGLQHGLLRRQRDTLPQSQVPDMEQRRRNLRQAFAVPPAAISQIRGRHIGVIDDVMTTGETLHALAKTLRRHGARRITNFVFARTP
ncbi:ComF family protein [Collimonas sp.]|uniref:ComF family protein n=1 Tax=Collimonas sp. TaxID=1963772 RepID=UPI002CF6F690|nr:ComF family protein [Collimonas sp.]HWW06409.1 ComF family protein [Collimonas sp.]